RIDQARTTQHAYAKPVTSSFSGVRLAYSGGELRRDHRRGVSPKAQSRPPPVRPWIERAASPGVAGRVATSWLAGAPVSEIGTRAPAAWFNGSLVEFLLLPAQTRSRTRET